MGIHGLMTYCLKNKSECMEFVDLVEVSQQRGGIDILVDFYSFMATLRENFCRYLENSTGNKYVMLIGAEFKTFDAYFSKFIKDLEAVNIKLIWFIDGGKGATKEHLESKLPTWINRHHQGIPRLHEMMKVCAGNRDMVPYNDLMLPLLHSTQMRATLINLNCEIIQCTSGEADDCIAKALIERPNAFAILTNDSDFCIFDQCVFMPYTHFDMNNDLGWENADFVSDTSPLQHLQVGIIISARLANHFQFQSTHQMIDLSILKGNDYTKSLMVPKIYEDIGLHRHFDVAAVATWICKYGSLESNGRMQHEIRRNRDLQEAVKHSRLFYTFNLCDKPMYTAKNPYEQFLVQKICEKKFNSEVITIYNQFYWRKPIIEDPSPGYPCVEIALTPLRQYVYRMILPWGRDFVTEYGRTPYEELKTDMVPPYDYRDREVPFLHSIKPTDIFRNLRKFVYIISHLEQPGQEQNFIQLYGRMNGFLFSVLRYFLLLNWERNLWISRDEFLALVASVTRQHHAEETKYQQLCIRPLPRTVTIASWFLDTYRHAYTFLGSLLSLIPEIPQPSQTFSGSIWIAYHSCSDQQAWNRAAECTQPHELDSIQNEMRSILFEKRHQLRKLVNGLFEFERWMR